MSISRRNTLIVDFSVLPKRPEPGKVEKFFDEKIQLRLSDTANIQFHNVHNCVFIEMIDAETALRYQNLHHNRHTVYCNGKAFKIPVYVEKESVTVRIHDLPPQMPHTTVLAFVEQYGTAISITRERWKHYFPGVYNGVRVLQMKLDRPIPSFITINGETTMVTYRNQPRTCRFCGLAAHPKQRCTKPNNNTSTEADVGSSKNRTDAITTAATSSNSTPTTEGLEEIEVEQNETEQNNNSDNNTENTTNNDDSSSASDAFTEAIVNQKRRLSQLKESKTKKICQQDSQNASDNVIGSNRFEPLVKLDWISLSDLQLIKSKSGKKGGKG